MIKIKSGIILLFLLISEVACTDSHTRAETSSQSQQVDLAEFKMPDIPSAIAKPEQRIEYLLMHYWDKVNFSDTTWIIKSSYEQAFVNYIDLYNRASNRQIKASVDQLITKSLIQPTIFTWFSNIFQQYLYDVNSPMYNEEHYAIVLESLLVNPGVDGLSKSRYAYQLVEFNKNRIGTIASDFKFINSRGQIKQLRDIKLPYTVIFFYDPECDDCKYAKQQLEKSDLINTLIANKKLTILAMYPYGDIAAWKENVRNIPTTWVNAYDASTDLIVKEKLYAIRAIPSFYLLDWKHQVLLRDASVETVINRLSHL